MSHSRSQGQWWRQCSKGARSFRGQKILQPGHPDALFSSNMLTTWFFNCRPQNTGRQRRFAVKIRQIKRSDMVTFLFAVHPITEAKQYAGLGRAEPGRWIFQPWCSAATGRGGCGGSVKTENLVFL